MVAIRTVTVRATNVQLAPILEMQRKAAHPGRIHRHVPPGLQHPDLNVAQAAIDALGKLCAQSAASPLAVEALGKIATVPAAVVLADLVISRVGGDNFDGCLLALRTALGRMVDVSGLHSSRAWQRLASSEASTVHARLASILVRRDIEPEGAVDQHFLKEAAIAVIRALAIPALYPALVDGAWDVAMGEPLLDAVLFAGRPAAVESFERLCLDPVPAIAALARRCLRKS